MTRVVVTGMGCVSSLGLGVAETWRNLVAGNRSSLPLEIVSEGRWALKTTAVVGRVDDAYLGPLVSRFGRKSVGAVDRFSNLATSATAEALEDAGLSPGDAPLERAAIVYGVASGGVSSIEAAYARLFDGASSVHPLTIPRLMGSAAPSQLSILFGIHGLAYGVSSACASSAHAITEAMHLIRSGRAQIVVTGGSDASLTYGGVQAWRSLQAISESACRPFSAGRDGTVLGEGAATLVLESEESAISRGVHIYGEVAGSGATADATHMTQPNMEMAVEAVRLAQSDADLKSDEPVLISAHGTGTYLNDRMESQAYASIFGRRLADCRVIATKSAHGHMLGATGAMEFLLAILALKHQFAPQILNFQSPDPECDLPLVIRAEKIAFRAAISTSFAFGGLNCALVARLRDN